MLLASCGGGGGASDAPVDQVSFRSNIHHVVIIVQENHTFDSYFGRYCTATPGSNPACTDGPSCCEAAPATEPSGASPIVLDDTSNGAYDRNHAQACELSEMDGGLMDRYVVGGSGLGCSDARNFAIASDAASLYHGYAASYALADRYFQPLAGQTSANDMYFAVAKFVFADNGYKPNSIGKGCQELGTPTMTYQGQTTIADLLLAAGYSFAWYGEGYAAMKASQICPLAPSDCPFGVAYYPCTYDPSDVPFEYYAQFVDDNRYMKDFDDLAPAITGGTLPVVSFVKGLGYHTEHPGYKDTISQGTTFVDGVVKSILDSPYADDTLILITWDEGGGFYDHIAPPGLNDVDQQPYGTRVPLLALGKFARKNTVSHVPMEHSSLLKFLELNFLGTTGQLGARDMTVNNIGSLLDPSLTGIAVP